MTCITADETAQILRDQLEHLASAMEAESREWPAGSITHWTFHARAAAYRHAAQIAAEVIEEYTA